MHWLHLGVIAVLGTAMLVFGLQNLQVVTVSFLGFSTRAPLALVFALMYLLGMATGSSLFALLRWSIHGARQRP